MLRYLGSITASPSESRNNTQGVRAALDFGGVGSGAFDAVLRAVTGGEDGNDITVALTGDRPLDALTAVAISRVGTAFTISYKTGIATVANVQTAIASLAGANHLIEVKTAGTGGTVLDTMTDDFTAQNLEDGEAGFEIPNTSTKIGLLTTAASQAVEVKPDVDNPSEFATTAASSGAGVPLTANVLREVTLARVGSASHVVAIFNGDGSEQSVRVYQMVA